MNITKYYSKNIRKTIDKENIPIVIDKEHTNTGVKDKKVNYLCDYCNCKMINLSSEEAYCNRCSISFFPEQDDMRTANRVSMPKTPEENPPLVAHSLDANEQYFNRGKVEPEGGLKALSESSGTLRITSYEEKDGAGRTIKRVDGHNG